MARVVIIASGPIGDYEFHRKLLREGDYLICVDGGGRHAMLLGFRPRLIIGDLDSLDEDLRNWLEEGMTRCETHPAEKDFTDTHLALDQAIKMRPGEILLLGCIGGRLDHTLANVGLLLRCHRAGIPARLVDERSEAVLISGETLTLRGQTGDLISLLPLSECASGITTCGLKYHLESAALAQGESRGVSNEFSCSEAAVSVDTGYLLVIRSRET
jgi:thiamine pyrophosphokinase